jgi:hypothetical protein
LVATWKGKSRSGIGEQYASLRICAHNTVVKDDAIPDLLQQENQPTFVTINERDFWRKAAINRRFCVVCFALPDSRAHEIPPLLRRLLHHPFFNTKRNRMGKVIRVTEHEVSYYTVDDRRAKTVESISPTTPA